MKKILPRLALLFLGLIFFLPFSLPWRFGPQPGFFLESLSFLLLWMMILSAFLSPEITIKITKSSRVLLLMGCFFPAQILWVSSAYPVYSWLMLLLFFSLAVASCVINGLIEFFGKSTVTAIIASALLCAALLQCLVCLFQFLDLTSLAHGFFMKNKSSADIFGQLGQRNHLGHFMMWGLLSTIYLYVEKRINRFLFYLSWLIIVSSFVYISSRTVILYIIVLSFLSLCLYFYRPAQKQAGKILLLSGLVIFSLQWLGPYLFESMQSGFSRLSTGEVSSRLHEWHKALIIFTQSPLPGRGWMSYAFTGFQTETLFLFHEVPHLNVLFTHCHNIVLQLLAETGIIGFSLLGCGFLFLVSPLLRLPDNHDFLWVSSLLLVSLIHSLLEYPLWYVYFFLPFMLLAMIPRAGAGGENESARAEKSRRKTSPARAAIVAAALAFIVLTVNSAYQYTRLHKLIGQAMSRNERIEELHRFGERQTLLRYYADFAALSALPVFFDEDENLTFPWLNETLRRNAGFRPFSKIAVRWGVQQKHRKESAAANIWLNRSWRYYPKRFAIDSRIIESNERWRDLRPAVEQTRRDMSLARKAP